MSVVAAASVGKNGPRRNSNLSALPNVQRASRPARKVASTVRRLPSPERMRRALRKLAGYIEKSNERRDGERDEVDLSKCTSIEGGFVRYPAPDVCLGCCYVCVPDAAVHKLYDGLVSGLPTSFGNELSVAERCDALLNHHLCMRT